MTDSDTEMDAAGSSTCTEHGKDEDTGSIKMETEDTVKPAVPSLLDLNCFAVKDEDQVSSSGRSQKNNGDADGEKETEEPTEIPFKLKKKHLYTACRLHYSLKSVVVKPFDTDLLSSTTVQWWLKKATEFNIRRSWNGTSAGMFSFKTYAEASSAIKELKTYVLGNLGGGVEVRYALIKPDLPYRYPQDEVNYLIKDYIEQPVFSRMLVLEGIPEQTTEEDLQKFFPEAKTIIMFSHDEEYQEFCLIEFPANHKLRDAMNDYKKDGKEFGSVIELHGQEVTLGKFMSRYNQAQSWLRSHPPSKGESVELSDEDRLALCEEVKELLGERDTLLDNEDDSVVEDKIRKYWRLSEKMETLAKKLKHDSERRKQEGKKFPEGKDLKINLMAVFGQQDEEDEEITAATGKVPSLLDINPYMSSGPQSLLGKRLGNPMMGSMAKVQATDMGGSWGRQMNDYDDGMSMEMNNTTDMLTKSMYDVTSGKGSASNNIQCLANTIQKATEVLQTMKSNPKNILTGPLETTRWCKIPLPFKKSLLSRSSTVKERVYITAYPRKFEDRILEDILCRFGGLIDAYFSKGSNYGYAKFADRSAAQNAILVLNDQVVAGSRLQLRKADAPGDSYRHGRKSSRD